MPRLLPLDEAVAQTSVGWSGYPRQSVRGAACLTFRGEKAAKETCTQEGPFARDCTSTGDIDATLPARRARQFRVRDHE